jgi:hypothetical protein
MIGEISRCFQVGKSASPFAQEQILVATRKQVGELKQLVLLCNSVLAFIFASCRVSQCQNCFYISKYPSGMVGVLLHALSNVDQVLLDQCRIVAELRVY